jgi:hypothetical protein
VCLLENVAAGIVYTAGLEPCPPVVLQPSEGMTARGLVEAFGDGPRVLNVPSALAAAAVRAGYGIGRRRPAVAARVRRVELLALGQSQRALVLADAGFVGPAGVDGYRQLASGR